MFEDIAGVILAGGKNERFDGQLKAKIIINGETIISSIIRAIRDIFGEIIIVTNTPEEFREFRRFRIISDFIQDAGPLGGIHAAIKTTSKKAVFVIAGDMPFVEKKLIISQIEMFREKICEALIPRLNSLTEPLHSLYSTSILEKLERYMDETNVRSVNGFLKEIDAKYMDLPASDVNIRSLVNINSPSDLTKLYS